MFHPVFLFYRGHVIIWTFFALFQMLSGQLRKKCYRAMSGLIFSLEFSSNFRYNYASFCNVAVKFECRKKVLNCSTVVHNLLKYFLKEYCFFSIHLMSFHEIVLWRFIKWILYCSLPTNHESAKVFNRIFWCVFLKGYELESIFF